MDDPPSKKDSNPHASLKTSRLSRGLSLASLSLKGGSKAVQFSIKQALAGSEKREEQLLQFVKEQVQILVTELGKLKGAMMKAGQSLSIVGEHFFPKEVNEVLRKLHSSAPPLPWSEISQHLKNELSDEVLAELEIDPEPVAAASIGQVHRATICEATHASQSQSSRIIALKIQYPNIGKTIESDLKQLQSLLAFTKVLNKSGDSTHSYDQVFDEVRTMLSQELDYQQELEWTQRYREAFQNLPGIAIPRPYPEYSSSKILATDFMEGVAIDSPEVQSLSQSRRDRLAKIFLEVYFTEFYHARLVQTDPHFGNYRIWIDPSDREQDSWVLLDFGAVREFPNEFYEPYVEMVRGLLEEDSNRTIRGARGLRFLYPDDSLETTEAFYELCSLFAEPFHHPESPARNSKLMDQDGKYRWGESDLPRRVVKEASRLAVKFKFRPPPKEVVFLDRKLGGVFTVLHKLGAQIESRRLFFSYLDRPSKVSN